jgi:hypothetical protein
MGAHSRKFEDIFRCIFHDLLHPMKVKSAILSHPRNIFNVFPIHSPIVYLAETPRRSSIEATWSTPADTYSMISRIENKSPLVSNAVLQAILNFYSIWPAHVNH